VPYIEDGVTSILIGILYKPPYMPYIEDGVTSILTFKTV